MLRIFKLVSIALLLVSGHVWADVTDFKRSMSENGRSFKNDVIINNGPAPGFVLITSRSFEGPVVFTTNALISGSQLRWKRLVGQQQVSLSPDEVAGIRKQILSSLDTDYLVGPFGNGKNRLVVLSAPNCPACRSMESDLKKWGDSLDVKVFYLPVLLRDPNNFFPRMILCAADPKKAWEESWSKAPQLRPTAGCLKSAHAQFISGLLEYERNGQLIYSTPTIVLADGSTAKWPINGNLADIKASLGL